MKIQVIAIGNILMEDDGVGIAVVKNIANQLEKKNIQVIIGETDFQYCISSIEQESVVIIIDAAFFGKPPGELTILPIAKYHHNKKPYTQHSFGLLDLININFPKLIGYVIGVEVSRVNYSAELSWELKQRLQYISSKVLEEIETLIHSNKLKENI